MSLQYFSNYFNVYFHGITAFLTNLFSFPPLVQARLAGQKQSHVYVRLASSYQPLVSSSRWGCSLFHLCVGSPFWGGNKGRKQLIISQAIPKESSFIPNNLSEIDTKETKQPLNENSIRRYAIMGSRRLSNYWWATVLFLGAVGFLLTGISSYLNVKLLPFIDIGKIVFFPQGLVMCFYGLLGLFLSFYLWFTLFLNIGGGFNEINKKEGQIRIFRWGFPGKNRRIDLQYPLDEVLAIRLEAQEGSNSKRAISLKISGQREIVFLDGEASQEMGTTFEQLEKQASELAKFLQLPLELG